MLNFPKKSKCKILFIAPDVNSGGAENILFNIVKTHNSKDVFIISLTKLGYYGEKLKKEGYKLYALNMEKNIFIFLKVFKLLFLIIRLKPKIVHTWLYHANLIGGILAWFLGIKKIYWSIHHDFEYSDLSTMIEMKILVLMSYFVPNKIIYCSEASKNNHIKNGYKKNCSILIGNGVSTSVYQPNTNYRKEFRDKFKISNDCFLIGNISRYHPIKDHDNLFNALRILSNYNINFKCVLVGKGLSRDNLELVNKINKNKIFDKVLLYGKTFEVNKIFNALDINILSSKNEGFGMVLIEAMSCGIPCISTNVGDAENIIGNSGWIVESSKPIALAKCIIDIINKKGILKNKSIIARKRVKDIYSLEKMILNYKKLYN